MPSQLDALAVRPDERRAVVLAAACGFVLLGSYYILRPLRDTVATVLGVGQLQQLFTATFFGTVLASTLYAALATHVRLARLCLGCSGSGSSICSYSSCCFGLIPKAAGWAPATTCGSASRTCS